MLESAAAYESARAAARATFAPTVIASVKNKAPCAIETILFIETIL